jgi:hypothetical protein
MSLIGDNNPPAPADLFGRRVQALNDELASYLTGEITEPIAAALRDVIKKARDLELELDADKKRDKQPHLDANAAIEAAYRPLTTQAESIKTEARKRLDAFLRAEEDRRAAEAAEARRVAQEAADAAAKAVQDEEDPFSYRTAEDTARDARLAAIAADHAEQRAAGGASVRGMSGAPAASLKSRWSVKVIDSKKLVAAFAKSTSVIEAATKEANALARLQKGSQPIPGCELIETRTSA